jgi:phosphoglycolate phosphatase-like HAD superfamily hydrolase
VRGAALWLFDIDGTLVDTGGAGMAALQEATEEYFGGVCPALDLAGATDLGVLATISGHFGRGDGIAGAEGFFAAYLRRLDWNLAHGGFPVRVLPGVSGLLDALTATPGITVGLLTGNIAAGAAAKIRHFGLDRHFAFGAYGCDHADRNRLGPVALERAARHAGRVFAPEETVVIGDTPKDIDCARAMGAACLAVATGRFSVEELKSAGAARVVETLEGFVPGV